MITVFPPHNSIRCSRYQPVLPADRHNYYFDEAPFNGYLPKGMIKAPFAHKVQYSDINELYFVTDAFAVLVQIIDCNGNIIEADLTTTPDDIAYAYTYRSDAGIEQFTTVYRYKWKFDSGTYPEGHYYIYIKLTTDSLVEQFISEPIWVKEKHPKTIKLQYSNEENDHDILYEDMGVSFQSRLNCRGRKLVPKSESIDTVEQDEDLRRLYGKSFREYDFFIYDVPEFLIDTFNHILVECSILYVDNKRYIYVPDGDSFSIDREPNNPLGRGSIRLREYYTDQEGLHQNAVVTIHEAPGTYPYFIPGWRVSNGGYIHVQAPTEIIDAAAQTAYVNTLNNTVASGVLDADGTFSISGGNLIFSNSVGDNVQLIVTNEVMTTVTKVDYTDIPPAGLTTFTYRANTTGLVGGVVWGGVNGTKILSAAATNVSYNESHGYTAPGTYEVRIYHNDKIKWLAFDAQAANVVDIEGAVSNTLDWLYIRNHNIAKDLNLSFLSRAKDYISKLTIENSAITAITDNWVVDFNGWRLLKEIRIVNNDLDTAAVDDFLNKFDANVAHTYGGTIDLRQLFYGGTSAPRSAASNTAVSNLQANGWIVYTD